MPLGASNWLPEGLSPFPEDDEHRSLWKWCQRIYDIVGNIPEGCPFPEGTLPLPGDDEERLYQKINRMLQGPRPPTYYSYDYPGDPLSLEDHITIT